MQEYVRRKLLEVGFPVLHALGKIGLPKRRISQHFFFTAQKLLVPGMICLTRRDYEASNFLQSAFWKHAAMFVGNDKRGIPVMIEAVGKGVVQTGILDFMFSQDHVKILKPKFANTDQMLNAAGEARSLEGQPYDYQFKPANKAWYCSEVIWWSYNMVVLDSPFTPRVSLGVETVTPQDFENAKEKWETVLDSRDF